MSLYCNTDEASTSKQASVPLMAGFILKKRKTYV